MRGIALDPLYLKKRKSTSPCAFLNKAHVRLSEAFYSNKNGNNYFETRENKKFLTRDSIVRLQKILFSWKPDEIERVSGLSIESIYKYYYQKEELSKDGEAAIISLFALEN